MEPNSRLRHQHRDDLASESHLEVTPQNAPLEFATAEELLRHDRSQTALPEAIVERLNTSLQTPPATSPTRPPWWKRWLGNKG